MLRADLNDALEEECWKQNETLTDILRYMYDVYKVEVKTSN